ncbi:MAG: hypothetical protein IJ584_10270, partial [Bacteroidales bacterium]|nr:hypothetical protein [Bacteroidales bacterium]
MFRFVFSGAVSEIHLWSVPPMPMGLILSYTSRNTGLGLLFFAFEGNVNPFTGGPFGYGNNVFPSEKPESRKYFIPILMKQASPCLKKREEKSETFVFNFSAASRKRKLVECGFLFHLVFPY